MPETIKITYSDEFTLPRVPNFIMRPDGTKTHIKNLPDKALKQIGDRWKNELVNRAHKARQPDTDTSSSSNSNQGTSGKLL